MSAVEIKHLCFLQQVSTVHEMSDLLQFSSNSE